MTYPTQESAYHGFLQRTIVQGNGVRESTISKNPETRLVNCRLFQR